ncbi:putative hydrolase/peptidase [gamma proteobacterium IMCC1989]|nr:putative hydrolase/peptidase [gamma proteobacterium IMCC1989]
MKLITTEGVLHQAMREWRQDLHAHPETAFEEHRTSAKVVELLTSFGLEVTTGLAETGVVAALKGNVQSDRAIGLRADMDALNLQELNTFSHCSKHKGKMHGCGHDGHTAMLLGAAKHLSENRDFAGTVVFIFQPAEEGESGAKVMCDEGLFEQFPVDAVYGMHNWPGLEVGCFAIHSGPVMASMDVFDITITGQGCHGGMPHMGVDPVAVAGQLIGSLQHIVSRTLNPLESGVVSITQMHGGDAYNVVPDSVVLSGTCRTFSAEAQDLIESKMQQQVRSICEAFGAAGELDYRRIYPSAINDVKHAAICADVTQALVGERQVKHDLPPSMGAEDFAFMLQERPGAYIWIGNGTAEDGRGLHNPYYDFNDDILTLGANYWVTLVQSQLALP